MSEVTEAALEAEAAEVVEQSTNEGQTDDQPAGEANGEPDKQEVSASKARRERRKAENERLRTAKETAETELSAVNKRLEKIQDAAKSNAAPKESDFTDFADFEAARNMYQTEQVLDRRDESRATEELEAKRSEISSLNEQAQAEAQQNWAAQAEEARIKYADFDKIIAAPDLRITDGMASMLAHSESGADVAYYLGTHKAEAVQIARLSPIEQAMALGRLESKVALPKPKTQSDAPDPISTVRATATATQDPSKMTPTQYRKWREDGGG